MSISGSKIAIGLFSGGLDSIVAAMLVKKQGYQIKLLHFTSVFFGHKNESLQELKKTVTEYGMELIVHALNQDYIDKVIMNPVNGYGKAINPCIDCHAYMFKIAGLYMKELNADFIFSGEVLGQRPMSQHKAALHLVENQSELKGYVLRPLSAKLLVPTIPEEQGLIDRTLLMDIEGRSRTRQKELAVQFGITKYPQPAGGCRLTDRNLKLRFSDLRSRLGDKVTWDELDLMCFGRHLKLSNDYFLIIPRDETEDERIQKYLHKGLIITADIEVPGPTALLISSDAKTMPTPDNNTLELAASIIARYTKLYQQGETKILINIIKNDQIIQCFKVVPLADDEINKYRV